VACGHQVTTLAGKHPARALAGRLPAWAWNRLSAGVGAKGQRWYDWALIDITDDGTDAEIPGAAGDQALLVRRSISTGELAFYRCYTPTPVPLATLVAVAGRRWAIEEAGTCSPGCSTTSSTARRTCCIGHDGDAATKPANATTAVTTAQLV
jgi:hypothetical protein